MRYFIELSYNGKPYNGWQIQPNAPSVQEELNKALSILLKEDIYVVGAGRTDTGVHARFYIAHFETEQELIDTEHLAYKLNRLLANEIAVKRLYTVAPDMHARFSVKSRTYKYFISKEKDPFNYDFSTKTYPLPDIDKMNEACRLLFEFNDFTSFSKLHTDTKDNLCKILFAEWTDKNGQLVFTIKANRFLRNMVRAIVGTMIEIGQGKIGLDEFKKIIESRDRCNAGTSVPGKALFLWDIEY